MQAVKNTKSYVKQLVNQLYELNANQASGAYEMCQIYAAIKHQRLFTVLGYTSFTQMLSMEETITQSPSTCSKWANFYTTSKEFGYNKKEACEILQHLSVNAAYGQLCLDTKKTTVGAFVKRCRKDYLDSKYQINLSYDTQEEINIVEKALKSFGMKLDESGQRQHSSEALLMMAKKIK